MKRYFTLSILALTLIVSACTKQERIAPHISELRGPVTITTPFAVSDNNPDFSGTSPDMIYFTATFQTDTYWKVTLTGNTSGAVKTFTGTGMSMTSAHTLWDGSADTPPSFQAETVTATLSFPYSTTPSPGTLSVTISAKKSDPASSVLVTDGSDAQAKINNANTGTWPSDWGPTVGNNVVVAPLPDGSNYILMGPQAPWNTNPGDPNVTPYMDYLVISAAAQGYSTYFPLYADPTKVYFNMMVYNTGTSNTNLLVQLQEDGATARHINIRPDWSGWKQVSVNYTDFIPEDTTVAETWNPQKITAVGFVMLTDASQAVRNEGVEQVSAAFDHIIFTHNAPYKP